MPLPPPVLASTWSSSVGRSSGRRDTCEETGHRRCKALVDTLAVSLADMEMQTPGETLVKVEATVLVDTPFQTAQEKLTRVKSEA